MRPVLSSLQTSILALSLGATGLVFAGACGDEEEPANNNNSWNPNDPNNPNNPGGGQDAGTGNNNLDAGNGGQSQCITVPGSSLAGVPCTTSTGEGGFQLCSSGVPSGECKTGPELIGSVFGDGGFGNIFGDGGFNFPDGGFNIPDGALDNLPDCPANLPCSATLASFASFVPNAPSGASVCASGLFPPSCTTEQDCVDMGMTGALCLDTMLIGKYCLQICTLP